MKQAAKLLWLVIFLHCGGKLYASCCSSASAGGAGRLLAHERALIQLSLGNRFLLGVFNERSVFSSSSSSEIPHFSSNQELQVMMRVHKYLAPFAKVSMRTQKSAVRVGSSLADSIIGVRVPILNDGEIKFLPAISLLGSWIFPTGVASGQGGEYRSEYITSMGASRVNLSVFMEKDFEPITYSLGYGLTFEPPISEQEVSLGATHALTFSLGLSDFLPGYISASLTPTFVSSMRIDGEKIPKSSKRKLALAFSYAKKIHSHITFLAGIGSDIPFDYLGANFKSEASFTLGLRFGVF